MNKDVPASAFVAVPAALKINPAIRTFAARPKAGGKLTKVTITAVMRRLIVIKQAVLRQVSR